MSRSLLNKQAVFARNLSDLIRWVWNNMQDGNDEFVTFGEVFRTPEQAALNAASGKGIANSLHTQRLAADLNLFVNGVYQTRSESYRHIGAYWKSMDEDNRWGGDFSKPDGNHFSMEHNGIR